MVCARVLPGRGCCTHIHTLPGDRTSLVRSQRRTDICWARHFNMKIWPLEALLGPNSRRDWKQHIPHYTHLSREAWPLTLDPSRRAFSLCTQPLGFRTATQRVGDACPDFNRTEPLKPSRKKNVDSPLDADKSPRALSF